MLRSALALALFVLSGCVADGVERDDSPARKVGANRSPEFAMPAIELVSGRFTTLELGGIGYAVVRVVSAENVTYNVTINHSELNQTEFGYTGAENLREAYRSLSNQTAFFVFPEGDLPAFGPSNFEFGWWGIRGYQFTRPHVSSQLDGAVHLSPGTTTLFVVATTVPGYSVRFSAGAVESEITHRVALRSDEAYRTVLPEPSDTSTANQNGARVNRERVWETGFLQLSEPSLVVGVHWNIKHGDVQYQGVTSDHVSMGPTRSAPEPRPGIGGGSGAATGVWNRMVLSPETPSQIEMYRRLVETHVGTYDVGNAGIRLVTIPLH